ncbi:MAG: iron ABC transporter substrate-binding protein [Caldilineaceae bacterium]|nr:iron ABC transporter substrate-binding protein [Caldilineaceae bacterium]
MNGYLSRILFGSSRGTIASRLLCGFFLCLTAGLAACTLPVPAEESQTLVVYSGRNENLVAPVIESFAAETGIKVEVRYGGTSAMAATILEEGENSPADVFYGQDAGALGALAKAGRLQALPEDVQSLVDPSWVASDGSWIGTSLRARVLVYNTEELAVEDLPANIHDLTDEQWRGRVGWAPTNGSFQAFVTALRVLEGEEAAKAWLEAMIANDVQVYPKNTPIVAATGAGEISVGLVNHYYLLRFLAEDTEFKAANYHFSEPGAGSMVNVAGAGIVDSCANCGAAEAFVRYLLSEAAQDYFLSTTHEYPVVSGQRELPSGAVPLDMVALPEIDLSDLEDLEGTLTLLRAVGALE